MRWQGLKDKDVVGSFKTIIGKCNFLKVEGFKRNNVSSVCDKWTNKIIIYRHVTSIFGDKDIINIILYGQLILN